MSLLLLLILSINQSTIYLDTALQRMMHSLNCITITHEIYNRNIN